MGGDLKLSLEVASRARSFKGQKQKDEASSRGEGSLCPGGAEQCPAALGSQGAHVGTYKPPRAAAGFVVTGCDARSLQTPASHGLSSAGATRAARPKRAFLRKPVWDGAALPELCGLSAGSRISFPARPACVSSPGAAGAVSAAGGGSRS